MALVHMLLSTLVSVFVSRHLVQCPASNINPVVGIKQTPYRSSQSLKAFDADLPNLQSLCKYKQCGGGSDSLISVWLVVVVVVLT
jgi:hypothetical protein